MSSGVEPERRRQRGRGDRAEALEPAAQDLDQRLVARPRRSRVAPRAPRSAGSSARVRPQRAELRQALGGDPQRRRPAARSRAARLSRAERRRATSSQPALRSRLARRVRKPSQTSASCSSSALAGSGQASLAHPRDRLGIEPAEIGGVLRGEPAPAHHRLGAALLQRRVVEKGVGPRRQHLERQRRGLRSGRARRRGSSPASMRRSSRSRPSMSIASCRQSAMVWRTSGWSGISRSPTRFSAQAIWSGKTAAIRSSASMRASCGGTLRAAAEARQRQRDAGDPAPARGEHRRVEQRLRSAPSRTLAECR